MNKLKRFLAILLVVFMLTAALPVETFAAAAAQDKLQEDGLITDVPEGMTVTSTNGKNDKNTWTKAEDVTHDDHAVYMGKKGAKLSITTNQKCYVVFDYTLIDSAPVTAKTFVYGPTNGSTYATVSDLYLRIIPIDSADTSSTTWHTGVVDCTNETYKTAQFEIKNSDTTTVYISNIRIYGENNLPDTCKAHVTFTFNKEHGTLSGYIYRNGSSLAGKIVNFDNEMQTTFDVPIDSVINNAKFIPTDGVSFEGFKITDPNSIVTDVEAINSSTKSYFYFTDTGNYTIEVITSKSADTAELKVLGKDGNEIASKGKTDYGDLYVQKTEDTEWKIQLTKGDAAYNSVTVTDNGSAVALTPGEGDVSYYVPPTDGEVHEIKIVYSQTDCADTTQNVVLWNTLDFKDAFGDNNGLQDDFWAGAPDALSKWTAVDEKNGKSGGTKYNLMYDPNPPMGKDENHQIIFSSRRSSYSDMYNYENVFTFDKAGLFSFDYAIANEKNKDNQYDDSRYTFYAFYTPKTGKGNNIVNITSGISGWQHVQAEVEAGSTIKISFLDEAQVGTWLGISNISFLSDKVMLTVDKEGSGTVTGDGEHYKGQTVTLEATPSDNYAFVGWYEGERLLSTESVLPYTLKDAVTLKAKFVPVQDKVAQIGANFYDTLDAAFEAAQTMEGNTVVRLLGTNYTLQSNFTVPADETLLLPCSIGDSGYDPTTGFNPDAKEVGSKRTGMVGEKYFTFTIPSGVTLTVEGTVLVNAVTGRPQAGHLDMDVNGDYAQIDLAGNILVKSGGVLDVCGYVKAATSGDCTITAEPGGEVRDLYIVRNWRGGSQAFAMFPTVYPMNQVDMHNIEVKTVIEAGAKFVGTVKMYASGSYYYTRFPQVDQENGLIQQDTGTVTRTYDTVSGRETWVLDGTGEISSSILTIVGMPLSTGTFLYPIDGDMDFVVKGDWSVVERLKFMPGVTVKFESGTLTLEETTVREPRGNEIVFYPNFQPTDPVNTDNTQYPSSRGPAQLTIYGDTTTNVNCAFGGEVVVDEEATAANPAVIKFMAGKDVKVTSKEANYYYNDSKNGGQTMRDLTFTATLGGYQVQSGETYTCYYEGDTLIIELAGESKTQEETYDKTTKKWSGADSGTVEYKIGDDWSSQPPVNAGTYPVRQVEKTESNYKLVKSLGTLTVKPIVAEFALNESGFTYDQSEHTVTAKVTNAKDGDVLTVTLDGDVTKTDGGSYTATVTGIDGAAKDNYTIEGSQTLSLSWSIAPKQEATPTGLNYEYEGNVTGLSAGEKYKIDGAEVTADEDGKTPIQDNWYGKTVDVVKAGDGQNTADSVAAQLQIPTRPEAPTVDHTDATGSSASNGTITVHVEEGKSYEYHDKNSDEWETVPEDGVISELPAGTYEVRVKQGASNFAGEPYTVRVTYPTPIPSSTTETTTNPDGSTTTTTTKSDGTKTETTTQTDGTVTEKITEKDGTSVETTTTPEGVVGTTGKDASGNVTNAEVTVPQGGSEGVVKAPVEVPSAGSTKDAPQINVHVQGEESVKMEVPVTDFGPGTVAVVVHPDGTEEVVRDCVVGEDGVILNVEGDVTLKIVENSAEFKDIERVESWAGDAIEFTSARELFSGTGNNNFQPDGKMSRGALVTLLYRLSYEPDAPALKFGDVDESSIYADAVAWADSNSIVNGYGNGTFMPDNVITREQLVTLIYQYAQFKGVVKPNTGNINTFTDADKVSNYAKEAMAWAIGAGIVSGQGNNTLNPTGSTTRAQTAVILMKLCDYMAK